MSTPSQPPPGEGDRLGGYTLEARIGAGGIAEVWRARGPGGELAAVKVLLPERISAEEVERLRREFETLRRFDHPHIVRVLDHGLADDYPWLAMEYIEGRDLQSLLDTWREEPPAVRAERASAVLEDLCRALDTVHRAGVIHRDIKPSNVLIDASGRALLTDFGGIKAPDSFQTALTVAGTLVGTVAFMAPEQITGDPLDARTDLYALGAVLYALLTGRLPVEAETIPEFLTRHLTETPVSPAQLTPGISSRLSRICEKLLRKDPDQRYASAAQVLGALRAPRGRPMLRGRQRALAALDRALAEGQGGALAIEGPAGSGRSALLDEAEDRARELGLTLTRLSPRALALPHPPTALMLVDDLHLARPEAIRALAAAAENAGVLLIWTADPSRARRDSAAALGSLRAVSESLPLQPLPVEDTVGWLREQGLPPAASAALGRRLHATCRGNPGATAEQIQALMDAGWLTRADAGYRLAVPLAHLRAAPLPLPARQRQAVLEALERLEPAALEVLDRLVVLNDAMTSDLLERLSPGGAAQLTGLAEAGLIQRREEGLHQVVTLVSAPVRSLLYQRLAPARRAALHRELGEALARRRRRRRGAARAAGEHLLAGEAPALAWPLLTEAARQAASAGAWGEALAIAAAALGAREAALAALPPAEGAALLGALAELRGRALLETGRAEAAVAPLSEALSLTAHPPDRAALGAALGRALVESGEPERAIPVLNTALADTRRSAADKDCCGAACEPSIRVTLAQALTAAGDADALAAWDRALEGVEGAARGEALLGRGRYRLEQGDLAGARADLEPAERALAPLQPGRSRVECGIQLARLALAAGDYRCAIIHSAEAEALAQELGDLPRAARAGAMRARTLAALGEREAARDAAGDAAALARALGGPLADEVAALGPLAGLREEPGLRPAVDRIPLLLAAGRAGEAEALLPFNAAGLALEIALAQGRTDDAMGLARLISARLDGELAASFRARPELAALL